MSGKEPLKQLEVAGITEQLNDLYADENSVLAPKVAELGFEALRNLWTAAWPRPAQGFRTTVIETVAYLTRTCHLNCYTSVL